MGFPSSYSTEPNEWLVPKTPMCTQRSRSPSRKHCGKDRQSNAPAERYGHLNLLPACPAVNLEGTSFTSQVSMMLALTIMAGCIFCVFLVTFCLTISAAQGKGPLKLEHYSTNLTNRLPSGRACTSQVRRVFSVLEEHCLYSCDDRFECGLPTILR